MLKRFLFFLMILLAVLLPWQGSIWLDAHAAERLTDEGQYAAAAERFAGAARRQIIGRASLWRQAARNWALAGEDARADAAFQRAADTLHPEDWVTWGQVRWRLGQPEAALQVWERAYEQGIRTPELLTVLAVAYSRLGKYTAEQTALQELLQLDDSQAWAHYQLAAWQSAALDAEALRHLRVVAGLDESLAGPADALRQALNQALADGNPLPVGRVLAGQGLWPQARAAFERAVQRAPQDGPAWAWLAEAIQQTGGDPQPALQQALALAPDSAEVWGLRGLYLGRQGQWEDARDAFQQAVRLSPDDPTWLPALGNALAQTGDLPPAIQAYRDAVRLGPDEPHYAYLLGLFFLEYNIALEGEGLDAALRAWLAAPDNPQYALLVGRYYLALNQPEAAFKYLQIARQNAPDDAESALYWGIWQAQFGDRQQARAALQQAARSSQEAVRRQAQFWLERIP